MLKRDLDDNGRVAWRPGEAHRSAETGDFAKAWYVGGRASTWRLLPRSVGGEPRRVRTYHRSPGRSRQDRRRHRHHRLAVRLRDAGDRQGSPLRDKAEETLGSSGSEVDHWEVAVVHRDHAAPDGACARLAWLSGDLGTADHAIDMYKMAVLPRLQEMAGFCSASLMIDRETGQVVGTAAFDSR
jgi:hypothetical protein